MTTTTTAQGIEVHNGQARDQEWDCGGNRFRRVANYDECVLRLPTLAGIRGGVRHEANPGEHVVTFVAQPVGAEAERPSLWIKGGTSLHDVLLLWSFAGDLPVLTAPIKRAPTADEGSYALADPDELVQAITAAYRACRLRPVKRRIWSALLTYLEIAHVRPMQLKAVLVTSVLECMAPLSAGSDEERSRYQPIITHLASLPELSNRSIPDGAIEALVVELYRVRNEFLHGGVHPYRDDIDLGPVRVTTGRIVSGSRMLAKLAVANALSVPRTWTSGMMAQKVETLFANGSFIPKGMEELLKRLATHDGDD